MKRILIVLLCLSLLVVPMTVCAAPLNFIQVFTLSSNGFKVEDTPTFWEHPTLKGGDSIVPEGELYIQNKTMHEQRIGLRTVEFPYDDSEAMRYLNHLHITIKDGSTVLYDGAYSRINDGKLFMPERRVKAGESILYSITLSCDFAYNGNGFTDASDLVQWQFYAIEAGSDEQGTSDTFSDPILVQLAIAIVLAALVCSGIFVYSRFIRTHR